jgi:quinoprotein relay system zinc metallohydrolase 2
MRRAEKPGRQRALTLQSRRDVLFGGLCLCCLPSKSRAEKFAIEEVAPSVFMRRGLYQEAGGQNLDAIANIGFIIGDDAVLVTETGGSLADGLWLRQIIREKTAKPIKYVVLSHGHPDHAFGAGAFLEDAPVFIGHHRLASVLTARGGYYRSRLVELIGEANVGPIVMPTRMVDARDEIDLGGRIIAFQAHRPAHTVADLSLFDKTSGLLLPADLLFVGRVPALDGSLTGWIAELEAMQAQNQGKAVPGHGPVSVDFRAASDALLVYLKILRDGVRAEIDGNGSIERAIANVGLSERDKWKLFDDYNKRNVTEAYRELEWQ